MANLDTTSTPQSKVNPHNVRILQTSHSPQSSSATDTSPKPNQIPVAYHTETLSQIPNSNERENPSIDSPEKRNNPTDKVPPKPNNDKEKMKREDQV